MRALTYAYVSPGMVVTLSYAPLRGCYTFSAPVPAQYTKQIIRKRPSSHTYLKTPHTTPQPPTHPIPHLDTPTKMTLHLTLTSWTQDRLTTLLKAHTHPSFTTAFDALFAPTATFTLNGASVSRAEYAQRMFAAQDREHELSVVFPGAVEILNDVNDVLSVRCLFLKIN